MEELDLKLIFKMLWRKKVILCLIIAIFITIGGIYTFKIKKPVYESYTTFLLTKSALPRETVTNYIEEKQVIGESYINEKQSFTQEDGSSNSKLIKTYGEIIKSDYVLERTIETLGIQSNISSLRENINVKELENTDVVKVTIRNENAEFAKNIADIVTLEFMKKVEEIYNLDNIYVVDEAKVNMTPINNHMKDMAIFLVVGIAISCGYIMLLIFTDNSTITAEVTEETTGLKVLSELPKIPFKSNGARIGELFIFENSECSYSQTIKRLRIRLQYGLNNTNIRSVLITSTEPGEGKSITAANLGISFAQLGYKTVIIDADMRMARQHTLFSIKQTMGLSDYLSKANEYNNIEINIDNYLQDTMINNLKIFCSGQRPINSSELIATEKFGELITVLEKNYDIVIIDTAPASIITDAVLISRVVDTAVIVAEQNKTKLKNILKVKRDIEDIGGKIIGIALNKVDLSSISYSRYYKYYSYSNLPKVVNQ